MGMSAAQARLLSITARLTDNEMRSQLITNSKLRLADKSSEANSDYMNALNATSLMYNSYNSNGEKISQSLTPSLLMNYNDLKTQYGLVNSSGQLMVSGIDKQNYENSDTLIEFLRCYGVPMIENPAYGEALTGIYGENYSLYYDENDIYKWDQYLTNLTTNNISNINNLLSKNATNFTEADFNAIFGYVNNWKSSLAGLAIEDYTAIGGSFGDYINHTLTPPAVTYPDELSAEFYYPVITGNSELANKFVNASQGCYNNAIRGSGNSICYLHVLAHLMNLQKSEVNSSKNVDSSWTRNETTTTGSSISVGANKINGSQINIDGTTPDMAEVSEYLWDSNNKCKVPEDSSDTTTYGSSEGDKLLSNYKWVDTDGDGTYEKTLKTWPERIVDLYYAVEKRTDLGLDYNTQLLPVLQNFQSDMETALSSESVFDNAKFNKAVEAVMNSLRDWVGGIEPLKLQYTDALSKIPEKEILDESDPRCEWYKNLWYRMGGISETQKADNDNKYKVLDESLMNNAEWLQFAFEHGVLSMEQVSFSENGSITYPNMGTYDWVSIQYNNATDISSAQNDLAIAKAEAKYQNALNEIEQQDKKYDQDLKKLDTEHSALQTEYDSVKSVIDKNVERSFKAFS